MKTATPGSDAPGRTPTAGDRELLAYAFGIEIAARDLFRLAIDTRAASGAGQQNEQEEQEPTGQPDILAVAFNNHDQYADVLGGLLGEAQKGHRDETVYSRWQAAFETVDDRTVGQAAFEVESSFVATYENMLSQLQGLDGLERIASIVMVQAAQTTVFADMAGHGDDLDMMLSPEAEPLSSTPGAETTS